VDEREEESDEEEPPGKMMEDPYSSNLGSTLKLGEAKGENIFGITNDRYKEFDDLDEDERDEEDTKQDFNEYKSDNKQD
jgi:hypothetical protein